MGPGLQCISPEVFTSLPLHPDLLRATELSGLRCGPKERGSSHHSPRSTKVLRCRFLRVDSSVKVVICLQRELHNGIHRTKPGRNLARDSVTNADSHRVQAIAEGSRLADVGAIQRAVVLEIVASTYRLCVGVAGLEVKSNAG